MKFRKGHRNPTARLRAAVDSLPRRSREAMLRGIDSNPVIAGAYADPGSGGVCPMLAAHRNGGRTDLSSFARCWDFYTGAKRPRLATPREVRTLRSFLMTSLDTPSVGPQPGTLSELAAELRAERARLRTAELVRERGRDSRERPATGERHRAAELRDEPGWGWTIPARSLETYRGRVAAASEQRSERRAAELLDREDQTPKTEGSPGRL